ncbi:MAG TPA: hypothetical protein VNI84_02305 [Pyrinomonadaceae bacterium]|nr:hypothetical protein [Pyrinomonadaceae bacterium]
MKKISSLISAILCAAIFVPMTFAQPKFDTAIRVRNLKVAPTAKDFGKPVKIIDFTRGYKKGILDCDVFGNNCTVMNMPLLSQVDERIDKDVQWMSPWGCYDTSITTVISTALANRKKSPLDFQGRTKIFDSFVGDAAQPKEIKQLSYVYREGKKEGAGEKENGKVVQHLYFHEVAADMSNGLIIQKCNPYIYGNCERATNDFADSFRHWISTDTLTNEDIIGWMEKGYVVMIAYARYKPTVGKTAGKNIGAITILPGFNIDFEFVGQHKVVFSGFRKGAEYPLLINDVGNGKRYYVKLSNDLSQRDFGQATRLRPVKINYPSDWGKGAANTKNYIEYEGEGKPDDNVNFLVHFDGFRL